MITVGILHTFKLLIWVICKGLCVKSKCLFCYDQGPSHWRKFRIILSVYGQFQSVDLTLGICMEFFFFKEFDCMTCMCTYYHVHEDDHWFLIKTNNNTNIFKWTYLHLTLSFSASVMQVNLLNAINVYVPHAKLFYLFISFTQPPSCNHDDYVSGWNLNCLWRP